MYVGLHAPVCSACLLNPVEVCDAKIQCMHHELEVCCLG